MATNERTFPPKLDMHARYRVQGWPKIAVYFVGHVLTPNEDTEWTGEFDEDTSRARVVMVGDDREHIVDVDDLISLSEDDYCSCCGQIGCGW